MPMLRPGLTNNHITRLDLSWLPASIADPASAHLDFKYLSAFVCVPVGTGAGREEDVVEHYLLGIGGGAIAVD